MPCRIGLRDFFIRTNGDVEVCVRYPPIGNIWSRAPVKSGMDRRHKKYAGKQPLVIGFI
jgi:hypothetical protein